MNGLFNPDQLASSEIPEELRRSRLIETEAAFANVRAAIPLPSEVAHDVSPDPTDPESWFRGNAPRRLGESAIEAETAVAALPAETEPQDDGNEMAAQARLKVREALNQATQTYEIPDEEAGDVRRAA